MSFLSTFLSSNLRAEILRIFFGINNREIHLREIERRTGFAIGSVRSETANLVKIGLLKKRKDGNRVYFKANTAHPLFIDLHNIVLKTSGLVDLFRVALGDIEIEYAFIFGSIANGTEKAESDVDFFVIGNVGLRTLSRRLKTVSGEINREINIVTMTKNEFLKKKNNNEHFLTEVLKSKKLMIIGNENEFS